MARLTVTGGPLKGERFALGDVCILGRSFDADVRIDDLTVSRHHAKFTRTAGGTVVVDLGSGNGTFVNGERIYSPRMLRKGDRIEISHHVFEFSDADEEEPHLDATTTLTFTESEARAGEDSTIAATIDLDTTTRLERRVLANPKELLKAHTRLKTVLAISNTVLGELDVNKVLEEIMNGLFRIFPQADRGFVLLLDPSGRTLVPRVARTRSGKPPAQITISRHIRDEVIQKRVGVLVADAMSDQRFSQAQSVVNFRIRSVMCVPLVARNSLIGLLHIDTLDPTAAFQREDLELLTGIANQAALALVNATMHERLMQQQRLERDMQLAQQVQLSFLPDRTPDVPGMTFCASYRTAMQVGGDFYDFIEQPNGRIALAIGDVSGKGVPAALLMAKMTSDVRLCSLSMSEPKDILAAINARTCRSSGEESFVTFLLLTLEPATGRVVLANAGHLPPLVRRAQEGAVLAIETDIGFPLGVVEDNAYEQVEWTLAPGDTISLFTDGVTEAMDAERRPYGEERLMETIARGPSEPPALLARVLEDVQRHVGDQPLSDDMTFICFGKR